MVTVTDIGDLSLDGGGEGGFCFCRDDHDGAVFANNIAAIAAMFTVMVVVGGAGGGVVSISISTFTISGNGRRRCIAAVTISGL